MSGDPILAIDAMGGDDAPAVVIEGLARFCRRRDDVAFHLHGDEAKVSAALRDAPEVATRSEIIHADGSVRMDEKPSQALRTARGTSMWNAIEAVKEGTADAAVSAGNTGALMAMSMLRLRKMRGVHRPGMTAFWPTVNGVSVILDVGANLEADASQLVTFAIMGEAFARALMGIENPTVGILNIGSEETKGHDEVREAAAILSAGEFGMNYVGFIEGDDISMGAVDVVVTDGFTGNVAIKTAEGTARMFTHFLRNAFSSGPIAKLGALAVANGMSEMRDKLNPSNSNGAVLLGLNGIVVKAHGGSEPDGYANAVNVAMNLVGGHYLEGVADGLARLTDREKPAAE
ncbi:MAG: phosphate acyltransferase PlsX [Pseudomonadota bacterium]